MKVTVLPGARLRAWPKYEMGPRAYVLDVGDALRREYSVDAHYTAYATTNGRRWMTAAVGLVPVTMNLIIGDFDCAAVHGTSEPAPDSWRREEREKLRALEADHPGFFAHDSRGGYRIVYALPEPTTLETTDDVYLWRRYYKIALAYLARRYSITGDPSCCDWTRLFRAPHATRDPKTGPERRATYGDPYRLGALTFDPSDDDVRVAETTTRKKPKQGLDFTKPGAVGDGLMHWLLRNRGDVGPEIEPGKWIVRCPNRSAHTTKSDGTSATVLYAPAAGKEIGSVYCLHAHCESFSVKRWLEFFSESEKVAARKSAGIVYTAKGKAA